MKIWPEDPTLMLTLKSSLERHDKMNFLIISIVGAFLLSRIARVHYPISNNQYKTIVDR